ncbi:MAG TPA: hypothetical protein VEV63_08520 [Streptosporangiaceae bacterium]|nr:hypothetical protein [Streptosporangiaceae bacterium]
MTDQPEWASEINQAGDSASASLPARYGRRALMLGAAATGAGVAASLVGGGLAEAAPDRAGPVLLGVSNTTSGTTIVTSHGGSGIAGQAAGVKEAGVKGYDTSSTREGYGVYGHSVNGIAVNAISQHNSAVVGNARTVGAAGVAGLDFSGRRSPSGVPTSGVYGQSNVNVGVTGVSFGGTGVTGFSKTPGHSGLEGNNAATKPGGFGVTAICDHGTAVFATSTHGMGLHVAGKAKFKFSGVVFFAPGQKSRTIPHPGLSTSDFVLATPQVGESGVYVEEAQAGTGSFTITLSKSPTKEMQIAWFALVA